MARPVERSIQINRKEYDKAIKAYAAENDVGIFDINKAMKLYSYRMFMIDRDLEMISPHRKFILEKAWVDTSLFIV